MRLLVYSPVTPREVRDSLGLPEYSYAFVADRFRPVLQRLGDVFPISDPGPEAAVHTAEARAAGESCVLLAFSPPNRAPSGLACPVISVFAWEFETVPSEAWGGDQRQDWRTVFAEHGSAICLSEHTRAAVVAAMGADFPISAIPAPIHDRFVLQGSPSRTHADLGPRNLTFSGLAIDSEQFHGEHTTLVPGSQLARNFEKTWDGSVTRLAFTDTSPDRGCLVGFYRPEPWGSWSRTDNPWLLVPIPLSGRLRLRLRAVGYGPNAGRSVTVTVGGCARRFTLTAEARTHELEFDIPDGVIANTIEFGGLTVSRLPDAADVRSMALGLSWLELEGRSGRLRDRLPRPVRRMLAHPPTDLPRSSGVARETVSVSGVVYTTVLNPCDGRKNWQDLVTAFCWAFREQPEATLLLKMTHHSLSSYFSALQFLLHRIGPVKCKVVALHGFLDDAEMSRLAQITTYYVNSSEAEGLCMPLMEFLSAGVPAVAPDHTAMADYVDTDSSFVVTSSPFPTIWPQDPRQLWKVHKHRVDWESLVQAYRDSYRVATQEPMRYAAMSAAAEARQAEFSSDEVVAAQLATALKVSLR